jgi:octopine/nopaline transport system permease protein
MNQAGLLTLISFGPDGWGKTLLLAAGNTVLVAACGFLIGAVIGTLGAWAKISGGPVLRALAGIYTTVLRGIPDLLVIFLLYFGGSVALSSVYHWSGGSGFIDLPGIAAGAIAIGITSGALQIEVLRGAFRAVSPGEREAAIACGMPLMLRFRRIVAPLTLRYALPGLGNVWQVVLKESALVSVTGVVELLRASQTAGDSTGRPFDFGITAIVLYLIIAAFSAAALHQAERHLTRGLRRA